MCCGKLFQDLGVRYEKSLPLLCFCVGMGCVLVRDRQSTGVCKVGGNEHGYSVR